MFVVKELGHQIFVIKRPNTRRKKKGPQPIVRSQEESLVLDLALENQTDDRHARKAKNRTQK